MSRNLQVNARMLEAGMRCPILRWQMVLVAYMLDTRCTVLRSLLVLPAYAPATRCPVLTWSLPCYQSSSL
eukprot:3583172-Rhodomonas_salina.2